MSPRKTGPPRLHFSFRSPYSWLAIRRLRTAWPEVVTDAEWLPFWDPDPTTSEGLQARGAGFHYVQMSRAKHLYLLTDTKRLAAREGVTMAWPIDVDPWWELPHLAWLLARRRGRALALYEALVAARWGEGRDICTPEVVAGAAVTAGLDPDEVVAAPRDPQLRADGVECLVRAWEDDIFGIPYLRWGRHRFWGYDRVEGFLEVVLPAGSPTHDADTELLGAGAAPTPPGARAATADLAYDTDTAGGCG